MLPIFIKGLFVCFCSSLADIFLLIKFLFNKFKFYSSKIIKYNGMIIGIDDIKGQTLNSENFTTLVKGAYKAIPRRRMLPYGRGIEYIHICSPMAN